MPIDISEVRRAFDVAGNDDAPISGSASERRGDASDGNVASDRRVPVGTSDAIGSDSEVSPSSVAARPDAGGRARPGPVAVAGSARSDAAARGRSRAAAATPASSKNLERLLFTIHTMLWAKTDIKALKLPEEDARELATAINDLNALYGKRGGVLGPKGFAWLNLLVAVGGTYLPMLVAARREVKARDPETTTP